MPKTLAPSTVTSRDPKGLKLISIVEAAYNKAGLTEEEAQRVNDTPGLSELVSGFIAESRQPNRFKDEETRSGYDYPSEYKGPKSIEEQIAAIAEIFGLDPTYALMYAKNLPQRPEGAEGYFAVPSVNALAAKHFPEVTDPAEQYCRAIQLVHAKISEARTFYNWREGQIVPAQLRLTVRTAEFLAKIAETQPGNILIVAAQLGKRHRGKSVRRAREVFVQNEFGLGSLIGGSIALTHPERFVRSTELDMDCAGDEFDSHAAGSFDVAPSFLFNAAEVGFCAHDVSYVREYCGSASGFLPQ